MVTVRASTRRGFRKREVPPIPQVGGHFEIEEFWRQPLDVECSPIARRSTISVVTTARLPIEVPEERDRSMIPHFMDTICEFAVPCLAVLIEKRFGLQPELVPVSTCPTLAIPAQFVIWPVAPSLELIEQDVENGPLCGPEDG